jgi:hypothetical protein
LAAYEAGHKVPSVETFDRVLRAAGYAVSLELTPAVGGTDPAERGRELVEVLELAARFPARHSATLRFPRFASVNAGSGARAPRVNAGSGARAPRVNAGSGARAPRVNA